MPSHRRSRPTPPGDAAGSSAGTDGPELLRAFVVQVHSGHGPLHYDLMLQSGPALATWQLPRPPGELAPGQDMPATRLSDHRAAYLTYEGPVSGARGEVKILDAGQYEPLARLEDRWEVRLAGRTCAGRFELSRRPGASDAWTLRRLE